VLITGIEEDEELWQLKARCLGSLLHFIQTFYKLRTGREFVISQPMGRESHYITICRELTNVFYLKSNRLLINVPPGHGKSTMLMYFIAWAFAHYPDCQFMYISYGHELASSHTANIKGIMEMSSYKRLFGVEISKDSSAKDDFKTTAGGRVKAYGSSGTITGMDAGLPYIERFTGCPILDDMHKPMEVYSDLIREGVIETYKDTIQQRPRGPLVPMVGIGQCLHEGDLFSFLKNGLDGEEWKQVVLECEDEAGNILCEEITPRKMIENKKKFNPYVWHAQFQQNPQPAGGGIFKVDKFFLMDEEPKMLATFITADTAETSKNYNDATVFSFWGLYEINNFNRDIGQFGLHWIDCAQLRIEPKDLEEEFLSFYRQALLHPVRPEFAAIEKKSTGVTLISTLKNIRGLNIREIERTRDSGSKTARFLEVQPFVNKQLISLNKYAKHKSLVLDHLEKITANDSHRFDDIADTLYDAVKIGLIDKGLTSQYVKQESDSIVKDLAMHFNKVQSLRANAWQQR
jgi:predicted phage terminase large subunit-like protein